MTYSLTLAFVIMAFVARWLVDPFLGDQLPYPTFFVAVTAAAWLGGLRPALLAMVLGFVLSLFFFVPPRISFLGTSGPHLFGLGLYCVASLAIAGFGEAMHVTQRRFAQQKERLRTTLASIGDAVITTDTQGRITNLNRVAETLTGWTSAEAVGQPIAVVFNIANEETREPVENPAIRALREGVIVGLANHTVLISKDGTERAIDDSAAPIRCKLGQIVGCVLVFRDVTQRRITEIQLRQSEARKAAILDTALDCIITCDYEGKILDFNPAAEQTFGYRREDVAGREMSDLLIPPSLRQQHRHGVARLLKTRQSRMLGKRLVMKGMRADGSEFPVEFSVTEIPTDGTPLFTAHLRDITERIATEQALLEAARKKDEFLATLAHELRNPLAPLRNGLEVMKSAKSNPEVVEETRAMMERQLAQLVHLINDLMDISRISRGKIILQKTTMPLGAAIRNAVDTSRPLMEQAGHEFTLELPGEAIYVDGDEVRLSQVFANLLNNAAKYTEPGGCVRLSVRREGGEVVVTVEDNGVGIPAPMLPKLFEMFTQVDRSLERAQGGLGIGLNLVKRLVEKHGGTIAVESGGHGLGSKFTVRLPVVSSPTDELGETHCEPVPACTHRRILVVDDNRDAAHILAQLLDKMGHQTQTAHNGLEAVQATEIFRPDVILMDIGMPKLNGYEACKRIRQQPWGKKTVIVACTGWGQQDDRQLAKEAGFDHHLVKPLDPNAIDKLLAQLSGQ